MGKIGTLTAFTANTTAKSSEVNANFDEVRTKVNTYGLWADVACTVSVTHTYTASQTFSAGIAVTGNSTLAGTLTGLTGLTIASGGLTVSGTVTMTTAASTLVPGATSFTLRNNANSADNLKVLDSGATTVRQTLTVTAGGLTVSAGGVTVTGNSTITGTLGGLTGLTVASGGASITGNSTITGTLGGLTGLTVASGGASVTGTSSVAGTLTVTGAKTTLAATASGYASVNLPHGTAPSSPANGDLWTTTGGVYVRINGTTQNLTPTSGYPWCHVWNNATTLEYSPYNTLPRNVPFGDQVSDTSAMHSTSSNNSRVTIPTGQGGRYLLQFAATTSGSGSLTFRFRKNDTTNLGTGENLGAGLSLVTELAEGDYVTVYMSGGVVGSPTLIKPEFIVTRVQ